MAFWGVEIKPGKSYTHTYDSEHGRLRISQATLGIGKSTNKSSLQCKVGNKHPILLCNLIPNVSETCSLELEFEEDEEVVFSVIGQTSVHLSGYYLGGAINGDDSDSYGEDITAYDSSESSVSYDEEDEEDEYDAEFIDDSDDDMEMFPPSPRKSSVIIEEIEEDENPSNEKVKKKKKKKNQQGVSDDANEKQLVVSDGNAVPESEDEDGFPVSSLTTKEEPEETSKAEKSCEKSSEKTSVESNKGEKENDLTEKATTDGSDEKDKKKNKKNKKATVAEVVANESVEIAKDSKDVDIEGANDAKDTKDANDAMDQDQIKVTDPTPDEEASVKKKKKNKNKRAKADKDSSEDGGKVIEVQESDAKKIKKEDTNMGKDVTSNSKQGVDTKVSKSGLKTRTYANGLIVEEIAMGKPDGKRAIPGKKVSVNYVGKLLKTGDEFDSNVGKKPYQFRLGIGQVIKGWDVGVNGMRVGDKRKLIIPPSYAYGNENKGLIPADSWLTFDVELVSVQ